MMSLQKESGTVKLHLDLSPSCQVKTIDGKPLDFIPEVKIPSLQKESEWESRWEKEIPCICSDFAQQEDVGCDAHGEASLLIRRFIKKEIEKAYNKGYSDRDKEPICAITKLIGESNPSILKH